jgi:hypothetical protein
MLDALLDVFGDRFFGLLHHHLYLTTNARREAEEAKTPTSKDRRRDGEMIHYTNIEGQT